ncbi:hypothetical protein SPD48_14470 [Pseudogracilibacillus sp. SE30717A]|uniref:hypothetical protein n=1 Tax=Pseudogracilibacillus sp. SE30717A TaxID=3098293 RepID=UPI00300DDBE5
MESTFITQTLEQKDDRDYQVKMTVDKGDNVEVIEFDYYDTNGIFPLYNALINTIRGIEDKHIQLETCNPVFAREVNGTAGKNSRLLEILKETQKIQGVTIDAYTK